MKTKCVLPLVLFLIFSIKNSFAQVYTPFPDSNAVWDVFEAFPSAEDSIWFTVHYGLNGDTIINSLNYHKLFFNSGLTDSTMIFSSPNTIYNGAIREDTTAKKVYYIPKDSVNESIIYQFNLNYHDTVLIPTIYGWYEEFVCISNNATILINSQYRKYYILQSQDFQQEFWIEGIGSGGGILNTYYHPTWDTLKYMLRCFHQNDTLLYHMNGCPWPVPPCQSIFDGCYTQGLYTKIEQNKGNLENNIMIFPNPITGESILKIPGKISGKNALIEIYNTQGKLIKRHNIDGNEILLNASEFSPGLYVYKLNNNHNISLGKFLVQ